MASKSSATLASLIDERLLPGANRDEIDARIQAIFGERWCVVFTDMAGFSRSTARDGIIPFLALMHQLEKLMLPIVRKHAGVDLKKIADSRVLLFREPRAALAALVEIQRAIHRHNEIALESDHIYMGAGLGFGEILKLGDEDVFGVEVNFAAKLGEDLAGPYQIFATPDAVKAIGKIAGVAFKKVPGGRLGGTRKPYYEATYEVSAPPAHDHRKRARSVRVRFK
jgi:adenylate cyclase